MNGIATANCSDERTNNVINSMNNDQFSGIYVYMIVILVAVIILMLFTAFFCKIIFKIVCPERKKKEVPQKNPNEDEQKKLFNNQDDQ